MYLENSGRILPAQGRAKALQDYEQEREEEQRQLSGMRRECKTLVGRHFPCFHDKTSQFHIKKRAVR